MEELRTIVRNFKNDAQSLYRYRDPGSSGVVFGSLATDDRRKVVYLALASGDPDIVNVANDLTNHFKITYKDMNELLSQIPHDEQIELMGIKDIPWQQTSPMTTTRTSASAQEDLVASQLKKDARPSQYDMQSRYKLTPVGKFFLNMSFADLVETCQILKKFQEGVKLEANQLKRLEEIGFIK
jgi:hypothetical protein